MYTFWSAALRHKSVPAQTAFPPVLITHIQKDKDNLDDAEYDNDP